MQGASPNQVTIPPINRQNSSFGTPQTSYKPIISEKKPEMVSRPSVGKPIVQQGPATANYSMSGRYIVAIPFHTLRRPQQEKKRPNYVDHNPPVIYLKRSPEI